ncbi:MAG: thioredoxin family protein [Firmicutes bacterium]|nr:thioredoxin family protein [Bacillota bacterium]
MKQLKQNYLVVTGRQDLAKATAGKRAVLALVFATWCPFCRRFLPVFEKYTAGRADFLFVEDDEELAAGEYQIDTIPTVLYFEDGALAKRLDGQRGIGLRENELVAFIQDCGLA